MCFFEIVILSLLLPFFFFFSFHYKSHTKRRRLAVTLITLVLAPYIYVRKIACPRERHTKNDPRKSIKSMYSMYSFYMHTPRSMIIVVEKNKVRRHNFVFLFFAYGFHCRRCKWQEKYNVHLDECAMFVDISMNELCLLTIHFECSQADALTRRSIYFLARMIYPRIYVSAHTLNIFSENYSSALMCARCPPPPRPSFCRNSSLSKYFPRRKSSISLCVMTRCLIKDWLFLILRVRWQRHVASLSGQTS